MSSIVEIESAIEKLDTDQFFELSKWWTKHASQRSAKMEAIRKTSGRRYGKEGENFEAAVQAAGKGVADEVHEW